MNDSSSMWVIVAVVLVIIVFIVVILGVGLTIFFIARKRSRDQKAMSAGEIPGGSLSVASDLSSGPAVPTEPTPAAEFTPSPEFTPSTEFTPSPEFTPAPEASALAAEEPETIDPDFDPTRTVAINRESTVAISYGSIKFVSGVLSGQEFQINPEGAYIGRDESLSQIVVPDPRISKRHLWIGVRDGSVVITDQASRNGTFINDPRAERVTEATLKSGDTVILGESDVARFEYNG